ncbi:MFS transporter [Streptomyces lunaelactis]|uniref:MFS transporter n=7 Tax=Streptomyces lunaelactis TaxID=1535768 RepID=UPI001584BDB2|nr:MFS transporter [Streptomyces lunaelactis]NUK36476.1 MFS transporter [Streptomyces lunaelactis]NUK42307.1 MFS transporter [Streptomyces lunaelactis]NUK59476.1 MFS transporter [Streptomyces lunaelactis]NUK74012.1 MFS transporter [Streptomyces lunaelactis]NUK78998.1 MFS transporter [Streptomyces lunaelactis]
MSAVDSKAMAAAVERPAYRDTNVLRWLGAYAASTVGDTIYYLALSWAATRGGSPAQAGVVLAISAVPRALLMLGGGVLADRLGPRRVVIASDAARSVIVLGVAALLLVAAPGLWLLAAVAVVFGVLDALFMPAVGALPPRIAPPGQLARIQGMRGLASRLATVVGAPLGGIAVALGGSVTAFGLAGLLFALSLPLLLAVRIGPLPADDDRPKATALRDLTGGLTYIRRHRVLAPLLVVIALGDLGFVGPLNVGLALLADDRGWGASGMGWILAGFGIGSGAASLLLAVRGRIARAGLVQGLALVVGAGAIAALAVVPHIVAAAGIAVAIGLFAGLSGAVCSALVQTQTDPAYLGRVTSVSTFFSLGVAPLSFPLTGAAVGLWGTVPVFTASAAVCALGAVYGLCSKGLRGAELP